MLVFGGRTGIPKLFSLLAAKPARATQSLVVGVEEGPIRCVRFSGFRVPSLEAQIGPAPADF